MRTLNGYLELDNPTPGSNNLTLTVVERMEDGQIRQAVCHVAQSALSELVAKILALRGLGEEVENQRRRNDARP